MLTQFMERIRQRFTRYTQQEPSLPVTDRQAAYYLGNRDLSYVELQHKGENYQILQAKSVPNFNIKQAWAIQDLTSKSGGSEIPTSLVLKPDEYQIFLLESLAVPQTEFLNALNWRIRSLISFSPQDMLLDYFLLPGKKTTPEIPMVGAVVAKASQLSPWLAVFDKYNIDLTTIDIPELAMRNLVRSYEQDEKSTAFIYFFSSTIILNITRQKILYFTRRITWTGAKSKSNEDYEQVGLDIMRYFDYFQTQWRFPAPSRIFVGSEDENANEIAKILSQVLLNQVVQFTLPPQQFTGNQQPLNSNLLLALGGALRLRSENVATRH